MSARDAQRPASSRGSAAPDPGRLLARHRQADWHLSSTTRRIELYSEIAALQASIGRRREELAADEKLLGLRFHELEAVEKGEAIKAAAFAPPRPLYLTLKEASALSGFGPATLKKRAREAGFGWVVDGRWMFSRPDLIDYLSGFSTGPASEF